MLDVVEQGCAMHCHFVGFIWFFGGFLEVFCGFFFLILLL